MTLAQLGGVNPCLLYLVGVYFITDLPRVSSGTPLILMLPFHALFADILFWLSINLFISLSV